MFCSKLDEWVWAKQGVHSKTKSDYILTEIFLYIISNGAEKLKQKLENISMVFHSKLYSNAEFIHIIYQKNNCMGAIFPEDNQAR